MTKKRTKSSKKLTKNEAEMARSILANRAAMDEADRAKLAREVANSAFPSAALLPDAEF